MCPSHSIGSWSLGGAERDDPRGSWHSAEAPRGRRARALVVDAPYFLTPGGREAFRAEAARSGALHADGAVPVLEAGVDDHRPYAIVPPEEGEGMDAVLASGPLPWAEVFDLARRLLAIFSGAFRQDISHGHLRARDIRRTGRGWAVEGWGISGAVALRRAGATEDDLRRLLSDQPEYAAPDLLRPGDTDFGAVDRYAIGAALYHAATGRAPFAGGSAADILGKHRFGLTNDPMDIRPDCPPEFSAWLERMMSRAPEHRYGSFEEAARALEAALAGRMSGVAPLAAGLSAIRRSPRRDPSLARAAASASAESAPSPRRIIVAPPMAAPAGENLRRSRRDMSGFRLFALMLFIVGGAAAGWWRFGGTHGLPPFPWPPAESAPPPASSEPVESTANPASRPPASASRLRTPPAPPPAQPPRPGAPSPASSAQPPESRPSAPTARPGDAESGLSRWPGYAAGRAAFNEGARIFEDYRKARAWVPGLDRVPDLMETAARAFETAQSAATPEDADRLRKYTDQSYRLAMAARQAVLMHQDDPGATPSTSASSRLPSASRPRRPAPRIPPPASPTSERLQLAPSWNSVRPPSSPALRDFRALCAAGEPPASIPPRPLPSNSCRMSGISPRPPKSPSGSAWAA